MNLTINEMWRQKERSHKIKKNEFKKLYDYFKKLCDKVEMDNQSVSIFDILDNKFDYLENKGLITDYFAERFGFEIKNDKELKDTVDSEIEKIIANEEKKAEESFEKEIEIIKKKTSPEIDIFYKDMISKLDIVLKSDKVFGFVCLGSSGVGKSHQIIQKITKNKEYNEWCYATGHLTPLELYQYLYHNNGKTIIFDDVDLWDNKLSTKLLLASLWCVSGERQISYASSTFKKIPKAFVLHPDTNIILISNEIPQKIQENLKTRCLVYPLNLNNEDIIKIMYEISKLNELPFKITDEIKNISCRDKNILLNLRLLVKGVEFHKYSKEWKHLLKLEMFLMCDNRISVLREVMKKNFSSESERIMTFVQKSGSSRSSYFRLKQKLNL